MVYEADLSWEGPHSIFSSFLTASDGDTAVPAAASAPINTRFGEIESVFHVDAPPKDCKVAFEFSAFRQQHEEAAWTLSTFSSRGSTAAAASLPSAAGASLPSAAAEAAAAARPLGTSAIPPRFVWN